MASRTLILPPGKKSQLLGSIGLKPSCNLIGGSAALVTRTLSIAQQPANEMRLIGRSCTQRRHTASCFAAGGKWYMWVTVPGKSGALEE